MKREVIIDKNCQQEEFWQLSQNLYKRNRFVYNPKFGGINELITLVNKTSKMSLRSILLVGLGADAPIPLVAHCGHEKILN